MDKNDTNISVIIPVYNDPEGIKVTLESLINQIYPNEKYEILVVDNNSNDETPEIIKDFQLKSPDLIKALSEQEIQSSYAARNKGIKNANGNILVFLDADMWTDKNFLKKVSNIFKDEEEKYVGFDVDIVSEKNNIISEFNQLTGFPIKMFMEKHHFAPTCGLAITKTIFEKIGLFDHNLISGGDNELGKRVYDEGFEMKYCDDIKLYHPVRDSIKSMVKKWFRIGKGNYQLVKNHPEKYLELKRFILNLKYILPDHPDDFSRFVDGWEDLGIAKKTQLYLIKWIQRVVKHLGYVHEKLE